MTEEVEDVSTRYSVITAANKIGKPLTFLANTKEAAEAASKFGKCYLAEGARTADVLTDVIKTLHEKDNYTHILGGVSDTARDTLPRLGAVLDVGGFSEVDEINLRWLEGSLGDHVEK